MLIHAMLSSLPIHCGRRIFDTFRLRTLPPDMAEHVQVPSPAASESSRSGKVTLDVRRRKFVTLVSTLQESRFLGSVVSKHWDHNRQEDGSCAAGPIRTYPRGHSARMSASLLGPWERARLCSTQGPEAAGGLLRHLEAGRVAGRAEISRSRHNINKDQPDYVMIGN